MTQTSHFNFDELVESWGAPLVSRSDVGRFSGSLLNPRTMSNLDSLGLGPEKVKIGSRVAYPTKGLVEWMKNRRAYGSEDHA